jgi:TatD DNase family protein
MNLHLVDTHCHINMMVKKEFDVPLTPQEIADAQTIVDQARAHDVQTIFNVGTSLVESQNCITLAQRYEHVYAAIGIHPNDATDNWKDDLRTFITWLKKKEDNKIIGIGECGLDRHYPDTNIQRQKDVFKAQIELALEHDLPIIVHTRDAADETLRALEEFKDNNLRGIIHCFSEDQFFADQTIAWGFVLGIGGTLTYPKNNVLRSVFSTVPLSKIVLETDAPFLPPQSIRGQKNHPMQIKTIATFLAELRGTTLEDVAHETTQNVKALFFQDT